MDMEDKNKEWAELTYREKNHRLYLRQKALLDGFLEHGAISRAQHDKSLKDLTEKMEGGRIDAALFSRRYHVRELTGEDTAAILSLCSGNRLFYRYCPPFVSEQSIREAMQALPPHKTPADKYYLGYFDGEKLIAVMDFIMAYPDEETAFIGFFMTDVSVQNAGTGSGIIDELCAYLPSLGLTGLRLGWVRGNPQSEHFWHKNGFTETGVTYDTDGYTVIVAQRKL